MAESLLASRLSLSVDRGAVEASAVAGAFPKAEHIGQPYAAGDVSAKDTIEIMKSADEMSDIKLGGRLVLLSSAPDTESR